MEHVAIHSQRIAYRRGGEGPALLFLHGIAGSSQTWVPAMELLRAEYTMVAPDFLGHGHSAKPMGDYSLGGTVALSATSPGAKGLVPKTSMDEAVGVKHFRLIRPIHPPTSAFAGFRFPPEVILIAVRWYLRYGLVVP